MLLSAIGIAGAILVPTSFALVGELVGRRWGDRGALRGTALSAVVAPAALSVFFLAVGDLFIASLSAAGGVGAAAVLTLGVLLHQRARHGHRPINAQ